MQKAIWFSRHQPTTEQIESAAKLGFEITNISEGLEAGSQIIKEEADIFAAANFCCGQYVFGVFPVPLRSVWCDIPGMAPKEAFEAWNVARPVEGGKPTFEHKCWCRVFGEDGRKLL